MKRNKVVTKKKKKNKYILKKEKKPEIKIKREKHFNNQKLFLNT